jgi:hypothetical protein
LMSKAARAPEPGRLPQFLAASAAAGVNNSSIRRPEAEPKGRYYGHSRQPRG